MLWWMTVALTGYLKSHHATKQEAQPSNGEQSASRIKTFILYISDVMVSGLAQVLGQPSYGKVIVPHTPYDLDGVCSAYALGKLLAAYGHEAKVWLPHTPPAKLMQVINTVTGTERASIASYRLCL